MSYHSPKDARKTLCPLARCYGGKEVDSHCRGDSCTLWRWKALLASDPRLMSAIKREEALLAQDDGKGKPPESYHKKAVANVMKNPSGYGVKRELGFCGIGGVPT